VVANLLTRPKIAVTRVEAFLKLKRSENVGDEKARTRVLRNLGREIKTLLDASAELEAAEGRVSAEADEAKDDKDDKDDDEEREEREEVVVEEPRRLPGRDREARLERVSNLFREILYELF
jgi:hypothetical protein